ncbi:hypothetical protein SEA_JORGENSEN_6 [Mycobacterium phage Jorgensen]|nr:hypothetical protein SEA_JORGENSEN_6 [Mycobacterium phage Jorgensen]
MAGMSLATTAFAKAAIGSTEIQKISIGTTEIWSAHSPAQFIAANTVAIGTNSGTVTLPSHQAGDLILIYAWVVNSTTTPSKPSASGTVPTWIDIDASAGANNCASRISYAIATGSSHTSGTWSAPAGYISLAAVVVRNVHASDPIGSHSANGGNSTSVVTSAITPEVTDGSSVLLYLHGCANLIAWDSAPSGFTRRSAVSTGIFNSGVCVNTKNDTTSDGSATQTGTTGSGWRAAIVEIKGT